MADGIEVEVSFKHDEIIAIIGRLITEIYTRKQRREYFVPHDEIVATFLRDERSGQEAAETSWKRYEKERAGGFTSKAALVGNMVAWFSGLYTTEKQSGKARYDLVRRFERERVGDKWAYRPRINFNYR